MSLTTNFLNLLIKRSDFTLTESINDLKEKLASGFKLSVEEKTAISNFERYKTQILNAEQSEEQFHYKYKQLQVIANLGEWKEFLKENYF